MVAAFLTNAAIANVAIRVFQRRLDAFDVIDYEELLEKFDSPTFGMQKSVGLAGSGVTSAFILELETPFLAVLMCQLRKDGHAQQSPPTINEKPQEYIAPLKGPCNNVSRVHAEMNVFLSLLRTLESLPSSNANDPYSFVMGFHPFVGKIDLEKFTRFLPISAIFVLRLIVESYKNWYALPGEGKQVPNSRLHTLKFAQAVYKSVTRFRLSEPYGPRAGCECSDCCNPGLMEELRIFESDLSVFIREQRWDLYHQSPVVAGFQMTRILAGGTQLGLLFCNISQFVGVVLHLYNLLRQFDLSDEEDLLLEPLCDLTSHDIFRAPRPKDKFFSHYAAFQGMTYRQHQKTRAFFFGQSKFHERRIHPHSLSVMTGLNDCGFRIYCNQWRPVWCGIDKRSRLNNDGLERIAQQIDAHPLVCVLEPLESLV